MLQSQLLPAVPLSLLFIFTLYDRQRLASTDQLTIQTPKHFCQLFLKTDLQGKFSGLNLPSQLTKVYTFEDRGVGTCARYRNCRKKFPMVNYHYQLFMCIVVSVCNQSMLACVQMTGVRDQIKKTKKIIKSVESFPYFIYCTSKIPSFLPSSNPVLILPESVFLLFIIRHNGEFLVAKSVTLQTKKRDFRFFLVQNSREKEAQERSCCYIAQQA